MKCARCRHPLSAHYPDGCSASMWGGTCKVGCRMFVFPKPTHLTAREEREELLADRELMRDEMHGRDPEGRLW